MSLKQFTDSSVRWWPQSGYTVTVSDNGGAEASQDVLIRKSDLDTSVISNFARNKRWEDIFPEVPHIYRNLTLSTFNPTDRGDGMTILRCNFSGYTLAAPGSSGDEALQATSSLVGQLQSEPLSNHPKWEPLTDNIKFGLGLLIDGSAVTSPDFTQVGTYNEETGIWSAWLGAGDVPITFADDSLMFAKIIMGGETTYERGGWIYSYHTESEEGFTAAQLNALGKIVATPPGNPKKPSSGYVWQLASPNQSQSGDSRFIKTLDFRLIPDNEKNQFLYES